MASSNNKKSLSILKELQKSTDHAAYLIHKITGEDLNIIKAKTPEEIFQQLSVIISRLNEEEKELIATHDKENIDALEWNSHDYKLIAKGIYNPKYKQFGSSKSVHDFVKFMAAMQSYQNYRMALSMNKQGSFLSNPYTSFTPKATYVSQESIPQSVIESFINKFQPLKISNDNAMALPR